MTSLENAKAKEVRQLMSSQKKTVTVTQIRSAVRRPENQAQILKGLGLNKMHRTRVLEDTPSIRGMIAKVSHLVKVAE